MEWLVINFRWNGFTSRDEYRRWLPLIITVFLFDIWTLWIWGVRGMIRLDLSALSFFVFLVELLFWIGFVLLSARRFRSAGITRKWLFPLMMTINIPFGGAYLNGVLLWFLGVICVCAVKADRHDTTEIY